jgi:hypothetical protein
VGVEWVCGVCGCVGARNIRSWGCGVGVWSVWVFGCKKYGEEGVWRGCVEWVCGVCRCVGARNMVERMCGLGVWSGCVKCVGVWVREI